MGMEFSFPDRHLACIKQMIPELGNYHDRDARERAWKWLRQDSISKPYRVR